LEGVSKAQSIMQVQTLKNIKYKDIAEQLLMYITVMASFAIVESMIGLSHSNVHIVRDSLNMFLMLAALMFSSKAL
jgi:hypothetical protein